MKKDKILLSATTAAKARQKLLGLPARYRNYIPKDGKGNWRVDHMNDDKGTLSFMLIDGKFDAPKANAKPECPVFYATLEQQGEDVCLSWQQKWQPMVLVLGLIYGILTLAILAAAVYFLVVTNWISGIACLCTFLIATAMILVYLIRTAKHNAYANKVFKEIIGKNFTVEAMDLV